MSIAIKRSIVPFYPSSIWDETVLANLIKENPLVLYIIALEYSFNALFVQVNVDRKENALYYLSERW